MSSLKPLLSSSLSSPPHPNFSLTSTITKPFYDSPTQPSLSPFSSLPESHQIASQIMRQSILSQLYLTLYNKKSKEKDPNFDQYLRPLQSSATIEIPLVTKAIESSDKLTLLGDRMGGIYLYDINKKMVLSKKQVSVGRRIVGLASQSGVVEGVVVTTVAVVAKGDPVVRVYRYRAGEEKLGLCVELEVGKKGEGQVKEGDDVSDFPCEVKLSKYGLVAAVALYNGNILVYGIPEVKSVGGKEIDSKQKVGSSNILSSNKTIVFDEQVIRIQTPTSTIEFKGERKRKTYKQTIESMMKKPTLQTPPPQKQQKKKQAPAPPKSKQQKKDPKAPPIEQKKEEPKPISDKQFNPPVFYSSRQTEESQDYSPDYPPLKYQPCYYFLNEYICVPGVKQFSTVRSVAVTTKLLISWTNTSEFFFYGLYPATPNNISTHLHVSLYNTVPTKEKDPLIANPLESVKTIYPITSTAVSEDLSLLAVGLRDGTVQIWDIKTGILKHNFNKHPVMVKQMSFFEVYKLVTCGDDGSVLIHDLEKGETVRERTNVFESQMKYTIIGVKISAMGLAFVLDSLGNVKVYDLWRDEKVGVLVASASKKHTNKFRRWNVETPVMAIVSDQLLILSDNIDSQDPETNPTKPPTTVIQTFKLFQSLLNLFDALSVVYRKGIDREKVINIFSNLEMNQLYEKTFELPENNYYSTNEIRNFKKGGGKGLDTISQVSNKGKSTMGEKKKEKKVEILEPEIGMFSRKKTPKFSVHNEEWLINGIREEHGKKDMRENKLLGVTSKTEQSFSA